jgi:membrane peptidoglycan carboxypeptidase
MLLLKNSKDASMSVEHGDTIESGGEISGENSHDLLEITPVASSDLSAPVEGEDEETVELTPRQARVLQYLARRHMRNAHIVRRQPKSEQQEKAPSQPELGEDAANEATVPDRISAGTIDTDTTDAADKVDTPADNELAIEVVEEANTIIVARAETEPTMEALQPRIVASLEPPAPTQPLHIVTTRQTRQPDPHTPLPMLLPAIPMSIPIPNPQTPAPLVPAIPGIPDPQTPLPDSMPEIVVYNPPVSFVLPPLAPARPGIMRRLPVTTPRQTASLTDLRRRKRLRKLFLRHLSRKQLRAARARERQASHRLWTTVLSTMLSLLLVFLSVGGATAYVAYKFITTTQKVYDGRLLTIHDLLPPDNLRIYDSKGVLLDQMADQGLHTTVTFDQIAPDLLNATVATEDKDFWSNSGVDLLGIIRAFLTNLQNGRIVEGGSTISQQLIKNLIVGNASTIVRKLEEIVLAPQLNSHYTKKDILAMYLNAIYYGHLAYGIDAAATVYFGLQDQPGRSAASQLDLAQSAMLASLPSNPSFFDPAVNFQGATDRFEKVLGLMYSQGYISNVERYDAINEEHSPNFFKFGLTLHDLAPHFDNFILDQLTSMFHLKHRSDLSRSGLIVYTTLDINLQNQIQKIMQDHIAQLRDAHHLTNAAEVLIDFHTGAILSMLGSVNYNDTSIDGQVNVALAYRQPGSSFKPYVYVTAFGQGASPAQAIDDKQTTFSVPDSNPSTFTPSNYDQHFHGHMTLRCALQNSLNVPGVIVLNHAGVSNALQTAQNMGITSYQGTPGLSMVLGGLGIRLLDHTSAMGTFADGGMHVPYFSINKVVMGTTGKMVFQHQLNAGKRVVSPQLAYIVTNVLSDNTDRIPEFFDCNVLQLYSNSQQDCWNGNRGTVRPAAAKTGTTNDFKDNWTVGYTTDFVMGVWAGNDDDSPMIDVSGITGAAPIWHDSMLLAEQGHPIRDFTNPGGLQTATVTYSDGVTSTDLFMPGTVPIFTPTPTPTPTDGSPTPTPTLSPTPGGNPPTNEPLPTPYCSSYTFAFAPPADNVATPDPGWW